MPACPEACYTALSQLAAQATQLPDRWLQFGSQRVAGACAAFEGLVAVASAGTAFHATSPCEHRLAACVASWSLEVPFRHTCSIPPVLCSAGTLASRLTTAHISQPWPASGFLAHHVVLVPGQSRYPGHHEPAYVTSGCPDVAVLCCRHTGCHGRSHAELGLISAAAGRWM